MQLFLRECYIRPGDAKVLYDNSGQTEDEVCEAVGGRQADLLPTSLNSEIGNQHPLLPGRPFRGVGQ